MKWASTALALASLLSLGGCAVATVPHLEPEEAGLIVVRPYPDAAGSCRVMGENALTRAYLDHTAVLVGCPLNDTEALSARLAEGGVQVGQLSGWILLSIPL